MNTFSFILKPLMLRMHPFIVVALCLVAFSFFGCRKRSDMLLQLDHINAIIQEHPDSALDLLSGMDSGSLRNGEEKALYGLLLTMAEDKNYLDPKNDSIISYASEYFTKKGDMLNRIRADYYRGRVLYHNQDFPSALVSFFKAKDSAEESNEYFWEGMSYRGISDVYLKVSASADELHYAKLEYESFKKSGVQPYLNYALADLAGAYNNNDKDSETIDLTYQLQDSARLYNDPILNNRALQLRGGIFYWNKKYDQALPIFKQIYESGYGEYKDSIYYYLTLLKLNKFIETNELIKNLSDDKSPYKYYIEYQIYKEKGDYKKSLEELENLSIIENNFFSKKASINLASNLNNYYNLERELKDKQIKIQKYRIWLSILLSLIFISYLFIMIRTMIKRHKREIKSKLLLLSQLEEMLKDSQNQNEESERIIRKLFGNQFSLIEESCGILYRNPDSKKAKRQVSEYVTSLVEDLKLDGKGISTLEKEVNVRFSNIMDELKTEFPKLSKIDYLIYLYSLSGFSANIIAYFLGLDSPEVVYNRKRHLKDRIKKLEESKSKRYLKYL